MPSAVGALRTALDAYIVLKEAVGASRRHSGKVVLDVALALSVVYALVPFGALFVVPSIRFEIFHVRFGAGCKGGDDLAAVRHGFWSAVDIDGHKSVAADAKFCFMISLVLSVARRAEHSTCIGLWKAMLARRFAAQAAANAK